MPESFECTTLAKKALYKYASFPFPIFPGHHKVQEVSSGTGPPGWSRKRGVKWLRGGGGEYL